MLPSDLDKKLSMKIIREHGKEYPLFHHTVFIRLFNSKEGLAYNYLFLINNLLMTLLKVQ